MLGRFGIQEPQYAMASLPAIVEGPTAEEQMLKAEASCVSRQNDLQTLRHDKREFIKVGYRTSLPPWYPYRHQFRAPVLCAQKIIY